MKVTVQINDIRPAWNAAKVAQNITKIEWNNGNMRENFYKRVGKANGLTVIIDEYIAGYPVITNLVFDSEESYAWFLLRWA